MSIPEKIGRYQIERELGRGGMATVYLALDPNFGREVAIKVLPRQFTHDPEFQERFDNEARTIAALEHPAIVPVYDYGQHEDQPYLVMRHMAGGSLRERLAQGPLPLTEVNRILAALAPGLDRAHARGIIHRDLKPGNILFDDEGRPYLGDFGIARMAEASQTMTVIGTPAYMAPEQVRGDVKMDHRSDLYAVGVILFEMLTGTPPYKADTPFKLSIKHVTEPIPDVRAINATLPGAARAVVEKALAKNPDARYATTQEMAAAVDQLATGKLVPPPEEKVKPPPPDDVTQLEPPLSEPDLADLAAPAVAPPPSVAPAAPAVEPAPRSGVLRWGLIAVVAVVVLGVIGWVLLSQLGGDEPETTAEGAGLSAAGGASTAAGAFSGAASSAQGNGTGPEEAAAEETAPALAAGGGGQAVATTAPAADGGSDLAPSSSEAQPQPTLAAVTSPPPSPALGDSWTRARDGLEMVGVPAGGFDMGSANNDPNAFPHEFPVHSVQVDGFWLDKTEVTNEAYQLCLADGACPESVFHLDPTFNQAELPVIGLNWEEATTYCQWAGARLPTEAEWEYAARGPQASEYPWGNGLTCDLAHYVECEEDRTMPADSYPQGASWVGALHMSGNVWEWVNDWYLLEYYSSSPADNPQGPDSGVERVLRGGGWNDEPQFLRGANRFYLEPDVRTGTIGFRCAASPG